MTRLLKTRLLGLSLAALALAFTGCSIFKSSPEKSAAAVAYSDQSLYNYKQGQYYASAGRFELANGSARKMRSLLSHPRFRAAYDFLLVRQQAGEPLAEMVEWWTNAQEGMEFVPPPRDNPRDNPRSRGPMRRRRSRNRSRD